MIVLVMKSLFFNDLRGKILLRAIIPLCNQEVVCKRVVYFGFLPRKRLITSLVPDSSLLYCNSLSLTILSTFEIFPPTFELLKRAVISSAEGMFLFNFSRLKVTLIYCFLPFSTKKSKVWLTKYFVKQIFKIFEFYCFKNRPKNYQLSYLKIAFEKI